METLPLITRHKEYIPSKNVYLIQKAQENATFELEIETSKPKRKNLMHHMYSNPTLILSNTTVFSKTAMRVFTAAKA